MSFPRLSGGVQVIMAGDLASPGLVGVSWARLPDPGGWPCRRWPGTGVSQVTDRCIAIGHDRPPRANRAGVARRAGQRLPRLPSSAEICYSAGPDPGRWKLDQRDAPAPALAIEGAHMSVTTEESAAAAIRPFTVEIPEAEIEALRARVAATRWPHKELVDDWSQGVQLAMLQELARYWATDYDWRKCEAELNALPQFKTEIDGLGHPLHPRQSRHENALPLIITHGWPGSVIEMLGVVGPLTDPTAHGGKREDAFHLVHPVAARLRLLRPASRGRLGPRPRRAGVGGADQPARLHPLRRPGRRSGRWRHRCDGAARHRTGCSAFTSTS